MIGLVTDGSSAVIGQTNGMALEFRMKKTAKLDGSILSSVSAIFFIKKLEYNIRSGLFC